MKTFRTGPETERLRHRAFTPEDADSVYAFNSLPEVMRYTGEPLWPDVEETRRRINAYPDFDRYGYGRWGIIHKADQRIIGFSGFKWIEEFQAPDLGYRLLPEYWGQGIATEAARTVLDILFHRLTTWLAPILVFTMEEVWLERFPGVDSSVHLVDMPETPSAWHNDQIVDKWAGLRGVRRVVTAALEVQRTEKVIGASLEAAPIVYIETAELATTLRSVPYLDECITTQIAITSAPAPAEAVRLTDVPGVAVLFDKAVNDFTCVWKAFFPNIDLLIERFCINIH